MHRIAMGLLAASVALASGAAEAQVCCASGARPDGLRGYAEPQYEPRPDAGPYSSYQPYQPSSGPDGLRGYVGVEYGRVRTDGTPGAKIDTWTGEGAVSGDLGSVGVQGDLKVANYNGPGPDGNDTDWSPTLHVYGRNGYGLIGGWTGWSHVQGGDLFGLGVEGQAYMGGATIYGSAGYGHVDNNGDRNLWSARLEGRYFLSENLALNVNGGLMRVSGGALAASTVHEVGFGAEYQPGPLPFSIRGSYSHADATGTTAENDTLRVGVRWNFDGRSLADRDRRGPSLDNVTDLFLQD